MSVRGTALQITTVTLDSVSFLSYWRSLGAQVAIGTVDARGGPSRYTDPVEVSRASMFPFTIELTNAVTTTTIASVLMASAFSAGALDFIDDFQDFNIAYTCPVRDGRGGRSRDEYPNYVGGCEIEVSTSIYQNATVTVIPAIVAALSSTTADRQLALSINSGSFTLTMDSHLVKCDTSYERGEINKYDLAFKNRGAPTAPTGTSLIAKILTGTGTDSLISLAINSGSGAWAATEACVTSMNVTVSKGEIQLISGMLAARGAPTFA